MATMRIGSKGKDVVGLQEALARARIKPRVAADGIYGRDTAEAVRAFQKKAGLKADGVAGSDTLQCLGTGAKTTKASDRPVFDLPDMVPVVRALKRTIAAALKSHDRRIKICELSGNPVIEAQIPFLELSRQNHESCGNILIGHAREIEHLRTKFAIVDGKDARRAARFVAEARRVEIQMATDRMFWDRQVKDKAEIDAKITAMVKEANR